MTLRALDATGALGTTDPESTLITMKRVVSVYPRLPSVRYGRDARRRFMGKAAEYAFIVPALAVLVVVLLYPMLTAIHLSVSSVELVPPSEAWMGFATTFTGLANYVEVLHNADFWSAAYRTVIFTLLTVVGSLALGMAFALGLEAKITGRAAFRIILLAPWAVAPIVAAATWRWIFDARYGILNDVILTVIPNAHTVLWLADPTLALVAVSIANIWLRTPFMMIMLLAGLKAIPADQYEAAAVDGASAWRRFLHITLPNLRFVIMVATLLEGIWTFKNFDVVQVMTGGGPGKATEVLSVLIFKTSFQFFHFGTAAAMGILMAAALMVVAILYLRLMRAR